MIKKIPPPPYIQTESKTGEAADAKIKDRFRSREQVLNAMPYESSGADMSGSMLSTATSTVVEH